MLNFKSVVQYLYINIYDLAYTVKPKHLCIIIFRFQWTLPSFVFMSCFSFLWWRRSVIVSCCGRRDQLSHICVSFRLSCALLLQTGNFLLPIHFILNSSASRLLTLHLLEVHRLSARLLHARRNVSKIVSWISLQLLLVVGTWVLLCCWLALRHVWADHLIVQRNRIPLAVFVTREVLCRLLDWRLIARNRWFLTNRMVGRLLVAVALVDGVS